MIELWSDDFSTLMLRAPQEYQTADRPNIFYRATADLAPVQHSLHNSRVQFLFEEDGVGGCALKQFQRSGGPVWTNRERSLWKLVLFRPDIPAPQEAAGFLELEPVAADFSTAGVAFLPDGTGKELILSWDVPAVPDALTVTVTFILKDDEDQLRSTISVVWQGTPTRYALNSICLLPLQIDPATKKSPLADYAVLPALWGALIRSPAETLLYNLEPYVVGDPKGVFLGRLNTRTDYPNGSGWSMGCWGYYDSVDREGWMVHLEQHSGFYTIGLFQGNWRHMVWEFYTPQEDMITIGNPGRTLTFGYEVCLTPLELQTEDGWVEIGNRYRERLEATQPFFMVPRRPDRTDRSEMWKSPHIHVVPSISTSGSVASIMTSDQLLGTLLADCRDALGLDLTTPFMGFGSYGSKNQWVAYEQRTRPEVKPDLAIASARALNGFFGVHHPGPWYPHPWSIYKFGSQLNAWGFYDGLNWLRVSYRGKLRGEGPDHREETDGSFYRERTYTVLSYDQATRRLTVVETLTPGEWGTGSLSVDSSPVGIQVRMWFADHTGNNLGQVADPTHQIKLSAHPVDHLGVTRIPQPGNKVHVWGGVFQPRECPHLLLNGSPEMLDNLIKQTWGGNWDLHKHIFFYADVYTRVGSGRSADAFTCCGSHASWAHKDPGYQPHPQGGGSWWNASHREIFRRHREYARERHQALTGVSYVQTFSEYGDETFLGILDGAFHVGSSQTLFRALFQGEHDDKLNITLSDHALGHYRMAPLFGVVHPGRMYGYAVINWMTNGLLVPNLGRYDSVAEQKVRQVVALAIGLEWPWGMVPPVMGLFSDPALQGDAAVLNLFDDAHWEAGHPLGPAHEDVRTLRTFWLNVVTADLRWARAVMDRGVVVPRASLNPGTTRIDLISLGVLDIVNYNLTQIGAQLSARISTAHGFSGIFLDDRRDYPAIQHGIWRLGEKVYVLLTNISKMEATWDATLEFSKLGLVQAPNSSIRIFQLTPKGNPGLVGDFTDTAAITLTLPGWSMTALLLTPVEATYQRTMNPKNFRVRATLTEGELKITWDPPHPEEHADLGLYVYPQVEEYVLVRNQLRYPLTLVDGMEVYRGTDLEFLDTGLQPGVVYYYSLFLSDGAEVTAT